MSVNVVDVVLAHFFVKHVMLIRSKGRRNDFSSAYDG